MEKKTAGHTIYSRIRRVSVLGILVAMVLATGAGLALSLVQEHRMRDDTLTAAVQAVSHTLNIVGDGREEATYRYVDRTVQGLAGIYLFVLYDKNGVPLYFYDIVAGIGDPGALQPLGDGLRRQLADGAAPLLDDAETPMGADYCAYAAVRRDDGSIRGYVMAGLYLRSIRFTVLRTLAIYLLIGLAALGVGALILVFTIWSGLFFVGSIVKPVHQIEEAATAIARGDLSVRLPDTPYDDEIGRLCQRINEMAGELSKTERMQNEFISSVSHELRTPLTSIRGWVETIAAIRDPDDENYRKGLSIIGQETDRLYTMVEELLSFSRLQSGVKLECQRLDLVAEVTDAALFMQPRIEKEGLRLVYEEPELPLPIWADPARLRQVFVNVLDNAVKYSDPGGTVRIEAFARDGDIFISVADAGCGIAPEDLPKIKTKFYKANHTRRGSGIGLAVADEIIQMHKGSIDIESTLGVGTTVLIRLPVSGPEDAPEQPAILERKVENEQKL